MGSMKKAMFFSESGKNLQCNMCPRKCTIKEGSTGYCGVRKNIGKTLYSLVYGKPISVCVDPIEKKPFFHFVPGSRSLSVSTVGCNLSCLHCQNWQISQFPRLYNRIEGEEKSPAQLVEHAKKSGVHGFSWTYTEPTVFYEYFYDTALLDSKRDFYQTWVSNGYTNPEPIEKAASLLDAVNIDYKGDDSFYRKICNARLEPVLQAMKEYKKHGVFIEITNLVIPGHNDDEASIKQMCSWIRENLGKQTPVHFSAYYPAYKMHASPTPVSTLEKAAEIADNFLDFIYIGNIEHERENTFCPSCRKPVIKRSGFDMTEFSLKRENRCFICPECSEKIPVAGEKWIAHGKN